MLSTGIGWATLPTELGSGWTCGRRMRAWHQAGVFDRLHAAVLDRLGQQGQLDLVDDYDPELDLFDDLCDRDED